MKKLSIAQIIVFLALLLSGCKAGRPPVTVIAGADGSGSARRHLSSYVQTLSTLGSALQPRQDTLFVFRYDYEAVEVYGPKPPFDPEEFTSVLVHRFNGNPSRRGTRPAEFFVAAARLAETAIGPVTIVCLTDGGNDDLTAEGKTTMQNAAKKLAANPKVKSILIAGCLPGTREQMRGLLKPLGRKLDFKEVSEVTEVVL